MGSQRELKFALEEYWKGERTKEELLSVGKSVRLENWKRQSGLDLVPVGDFSFYDQVLDTSFLVGNVPERARGEDRLKAYFRVARGRAPGDEAGVDAGEMTKWFDTNYHYIVPEFSDRTAFELNACDLLEQVQEAKLAGVRPKPVILGPLSYLWLGKSKDESNRLDLLPTLVPVYIELLSLLERADLDWVQIDEPVLTMELDTPWKQAFLGAYRQLSTSKCKILLATYFGRLADNLELALSLEVDGIHLDCVSSPNEVGPLADAIQDTKVLSLGVLSGRNIWKTDLPQTLETLEPLHQRFGDRLWVGPSCSLLHVPVELKGEAKLDEELLSWLAFGQEKLQEIQLLGDALNKGRSSVEQALESNARALKTRRSSKRVRDPKVRQAVSAISPEMAQRRSNYDRRFEIQSKRFELPSFPTTTIGSFPQTRDIRATRKDYRLGRTDKETYENQIRGHIEMAVREQEKLGLDVLVHGEAERNDMVEYFGQELQGYAFSQNGWVQSYGSRCVKPPILFGDIRRTRPMTVEWIRFAQSLTNKPVKGMLTGPVTMLNWSFVRDDEARSTCCCQLALAIREEVLDLEQAGVNMVQIDEPALREGLPLRKSEWQTYLDWAVHAFRLSANGVKDETQIHTHMCYSEFNDIIESIAKLDADVITVETSRSNMELLDAFDAFEYPNSIGPGVYDIHSPNVPSGDHIVNLMMKACKKIPAPRLWINPDCGLKTRSWEEVRPALRTMVEAAKTLRARINEL